MLVSFITALAFLSFLTPVHGAVPPNKAYEVFTDISSTTIFAAPVGPGAAGLGYDTVDAAQTNGEFLCSATSNCLGYLVGLEAGQNDDAAYFILLSEGNDIATVQQANADVGVIPSSQSIGWRYNRASTGPTCSSITNTFDITGMCNCLPVVEQQDTAFGCKVPTVVGTSPKARRRALEKNGRIMPGEVPQPVFSRKRT